MVTSDKMFVDNCVVCREWSWRMLCFMMCVSIGIESKCTFTIPSFQMVFERKQ